MCLLDRIWGMQPEMFYFLMAACIGVFIAIAYYFTRWVFSIDKQLVYQKQQVELLLKIAEKLGVPEHDETVQEIKKENAEKVTVV